MTNEQRVKFIFRKYPETKFDRAKFWMKILEVFYAKAPIEFLVSGDSVIRLYSTELENFFREWAGIDRAIRKVLKQKEFKLNPNLDAKRYKKASLFEKQYAKS